METPGAGEDFEAAARSEARDGCACGHTLQNKCFGAACVTGTERKCLSRSLVKVHPYGYEGLADVVLPLQQPSCNGSRCPCEELALPI